MSTRSIVARAQGDSFVGRYCQYDGYPYGNGATLYALFHGHFGRDLGAMIRVLVDDHPGGWQQIHHCDWSSPV